MAASLHPRGKTTEMWDGRSPLFVNARSPLASRSVKSAGWQARLSSRQSRSCLTHLITESNMFLRLPAKCDLLVQRSPPQTALLDATMDQLGVLMSVVPGAGGYDAVVALVLPCDDEPSPTAAARERLHHLWYVGASPPHLLPSHVTTSQVCAAV